MRRILNGKLTGAGRRVQSGAQPDEASNRLTRRPATYNRIPIRAHEISATAPNCITSHFLHAQREKLRSVVGVYNETRTTPSQMPFLQTMVHHRSPQQSSPTVLSENQMSEGQQGGEPKAMAIETDKPKTLVRPR